MRCYIMKASARFMVSWFGMTITECKIVLHQWIMYADSLEWNNNTPHPLQGK